jgi:hypothetical protein
MVIPDSSSELSVAAKKGQDRFFAYTNPRLSNGELE